VSEATLHSASDASSVIYDWICNKLRYALLRKTTTSLYIGTDLERGLRIQLAEGEREVFRLLGLMPEVEKLRHIPTTSMPRNVECLGGYLYRVRRHHHFYLFHGLPDCDRLETFLYNFRVLYRTYSCPYMNNLDCIVYDEQRQNIRGILTKDTSRPIHSTPMSYAVSILTSLFLVPSPRCLRNLSRNRNILHHSVLIPPPGSSVCTSLLPSLHHLFRHPPNHITPPPRRL